MSPEQSQLLRQTLEQAKSAAIIWLTSRLSAPWLFILLAGTFGALWYMAG